METDGLNAIDIRVHTPTNRVLLITDTYDPGWKATVDGEPVEIIPANLAFRAVAVPAGEHLVRLHFTHGGLRTGRWLMCLGLAILLALIVACAACRRPRMAGHPPRAGQGDLTI
jgi:uncharacterized membrane protein YfhO